MIDLTEWNETDFYALCRDILAGMGMAKAEFFPTWSGEKAFRLTIQRESPDGIFRQGEDWLCIFARSGRVMEEEGVERATGAAVAADADHLLMVVFDSTPPDAGTLLFERLAGEGVGVVFLSDFLAETLALDYSVTREIRPPGEPGRFSFARLREKFRSLPPADPWRERFLPIEVRAMSPDPWCGERDVIIESDLFRILRDGSFLLLGESGAGKTASLAMLVESLAESGVRAPVFIPLGRYGGDLFEIICESLSPGDEPVSREAAEILLRAGALVLVLDGLDEVRDPDSQAALMDEIDRLTDPGAATSRSVWIASGRSLDYRQCPHRLTHLESRVQWIQPLPPDVIFQYLESALPGRDARALFEELDDAARERLANPLTLYMAAEVYREKGVIPPGGGELYDAFIDGRLQGGEKHAEPEDHGPPEASPPGPVVDESFRDLAREALTGLADGLPATSIPREEARRKLAAASVGQNSPPGAGARLLEDFLTRGILERVGADHVRFFHDTLQDYFEARQLKKRPIHELIPDGGVPPARRNAAAFAALTAPDPTPYFRRALEMDPALALDILANASWSAPPPLFMELAERLWRLAREKTSGDENRRWALLLRRLAESAGKTVEDLVDGIDGESSPGALGEELLEFYTDLDDAGGQRRVLARAMRGPGIPDEPLFSAAGALHESGNLEKALDSYTAYLDVHPEAASAYNNRGLVYESMKLRDKALEDYKRAVELEGSAYQHENLATLLRDMWRHDEAIAHLEQSLTRDPTHAASHSLLARWLEPDDPEAALIHREAAVRFTPRGELSPVHYRELAERQETLGHHGGAVDSIRRMIALDPTSPGVRSRKKRIAELRRKFDAGGRVKSARDRLGKTGDLPLPTLVYGWLRAAGASVEHISSSWCLAGAGEGDASFHLPVMMIYESVPTVSGLKEALDSIGRKTMSEKRIVIVTEGEALEPRAWDQLAGLRAEYMIIHVTAREIRSAFLGGDSECRALLDDVPRPE